MFETSEVTCDVLSEAVKLLVKVFSSHNTLGSALLLLLKDVVTQIPEEEEPIKSFLASELLLCV